MKTTILTLSVLFLIFLSSPAHAVNWCAHANIKGCYPMDGDEANSLLDVSSNGFNLTNSSATFESNQANCQIGECWDFDGNDTSRLSAGTQIDISGSTVLTVVAWFKYDDAGSEEQTIASNWSPVGNKGAFLLRVEPSNNRIEAFILEGNNVTVSSSPSDITITADAWTHVAITYEGNDNLRVYINGVLGNNLGASSNAAIDTTTSDDLFIGTSEHSLTDDLRGNVDEVAIFLAKLTVSDIIDIKENGLNPEPVTLSSGTLQGGTINK